MIDLGFKRRWIVQILCFSVPFNLSLLVYMRKFVIPGKINWYIYRTNCAMIFLIILSGIVYIDFKYYHNDTRTYIFYILRSGSWIIFELSNVLESGFVNMICDPTVKILKIL